MKKFNITKFSDSVLDAVEAEANMRIKRNEVELLSRIAECIDKMVFLATWTNRNWNLITSFVGVLFYNGKIVGKETRKEKQIVARRRDSAASKKAGKEIRIKTVMPNPVFSYNIAGRERRPWRWAVENDVYPRTGRGYAHAAVEAARQEAILHGGYYAIIIIAMPYATSKGLYQKVVSLLKNVADIQGKGFFKTISISTGVGDFDY